MTEPPVSRRAVLGAAGVVAAGAVAGYAAGRNTDAAEATPPATGTGSGGYGDATGSTGNRALAELADIPDGGGVIVGDYVIVRSGSQVHAFSSICPHQGCNVNQVSDGKIDCPCHGSVFDATTGAVLAGPSPSGLPPRPVTVRHGEVFG